MVNVIIDILLSYVQYMNVFSLSKGVSAESRSSLSREGQIRLSRIDGRGIDMVRKGGGVICKDQNRKKERGEAR